MQAKVSKQHSIISAAQSELTEDHASWQYISINHFNDGD